MPGQDRKALVCSFPERTADLGRGYHCRMPASKVAQVLRDALALHPDLQLAIVFGSVARGSERADSDVDIAVQAAKALDAQRRIQLVGDIALATGRAVDLVDLRTAGGPLLGQILSGGQRLLGSDEAFGTLLSRTEKTRSNDHG